MLKSRAATSDRHRMTEHGHSTRLPFPIVRRFVLAVLLALSAGLARTQQMAVTFDDLPVHGALAR